MYVVQHNLIIPVVYIVHPARYQDLFSLCYFLDVHSVIKSVFEEV